MCFSYPSLSRPTVQPADGSNVYIYIFKYQKVLRITQANYQLLRRALGLGGGFFCPLRSSSSLVFSSNHNNFENARKSNPVKLKIDTTENILKKFNQITLSNKKTNKKKHLKYKKKSFNSMFYYNITEKKKENHKQLDYLRSKKKHKKNLKK